jgi:hypothetical protein
MPAIKCPNCGLFSPEIALRCDCGYDFHSGERKKSYTKTEISRQSILAKNSTEDSKSNIKVLSGELLISIGFICAIFTFIPFSKYSLYTNKETQFYHVLGPVLIFLGRMLSAVVYDARHIVDQNLRTILYLRPFKKDEHKAQGLISVWHRGGFVESPEAALARLLSQVAPCIAIGRPGERLPPLGAYRAYVKGRDWQSAVLRMLHQAELVILRVGETGSFLWELKNAIQNVAPEKLIIFHPRDSSSRRSRAAEYAEFRESTTVLFPQALPRDLGKAEFLAFDHEWNPYPLLGTANVWGRIRGMISGSRLPHFRVALMPVFRTLGIPMPGVPWSYSEFLALLVAIGVLWPWRH